MAHNVPSLQPGCPWYDLSEFAKPNVKWCEAQFCSWVVEPANTWSNLAYIIAAIYLFYISRNSGNKTLKQFAPVVAITGALSGIYHASYTFFFQVFDFIGMYMYCYLFLVLNLIRLGTIPKEKKVSAFWIATALTTAITIALNFTPVPIQSIILILVIAIIGTEFKYRSRTKNYSLKYFWISLFTLIGAAVFSALDVSRTWCWPDNHFLQGHSVWHVLSATAVAIAYHHQKQFKELF